jgi:hypothetical protein
MWLLDSSNNCFTVPVTGIKVTQNIKTSLKMCGLSTWDLLVHSVYRTAPHLVILQLRDVSRNASWTCSNPRLPLMLVKLQLQPAIHITCPYLLNKNTFLQLAVRCPEVSPPLQSRSAYNHRKHEHVTRKPPGSYRPEDTLRCSYKHSWVWTVCTQSK